MPEGDTVWRAARLLDRALSGRRLVRAELRVPQHATADLAGRDVLATVARGKHLLTRLGGTPADEPVTLHTHLKMEGAWRVFRDGQRWRRPAHQARVILAVDGVTAVGFSLGVVELLATAAESDVVGHLGPDLLGPDWDRPRALARLLAGPEVPLRDALLDQRNLAGVGNMYAAELCFVSGVDPHTPVGDVDPAVLDRLLATAHRMLVLNKERPTQATTGDLREPMWVYRRDRQPCRRCRTPIAVDLFGGPGADSAGAGGRERAAYWCPRCQPGAAG